MLDALDAMNPEPFEGDVWRVTGQGRDPLRGSAAPGRWSPGGEFEVLYTSLEREGALAEIGYRLSLEPVWPSRVQHEVHRIGVSLGRVLRFRSVEQLAPLGVDADRYGAFDYTATQAVAAAAYFFEMEAIVVPSARSPALHLVVFLGSLPAAGTLVVRETQAVNWAAWRRKR